MGYHRNRAQEPEEPVYQEDSEDFKAPQQPRYARVTALVFGLLVLVGIAVGIFVFMDKNGYALRKAKSRSENFQGTVSVSAMAEHQDPEDCWVAYHGNVYDMTEYAPVHPGMASRITNYCGTDATEWYDNEHPVRLLKQVSQYLLGTLTSDEQAADAVGGTTSAIPTASPILEDDGGEDDGGEDDDVDDDSEATQRPGQPTDVATRSPTTAPVIQGCEMQRYTADDLWEHNDESSCWYGLYGVVYDVTDFIFKHPGGWGEIVPSCGTDATDAYENERFHNVNLLIEIGFSEYIIGRQGSTSGIEIVPCDEVSLVSVGLSSRN